MLRSGPDRVEYNRVGPSRGHKIYLFRVRSGSGKDIAGHYGGRGGKNLALQDSTLDDLILCLKVQKRVCRIHLIMSFQKFDHKCQAVQGLIKDRGSLFR